MKNILRTIFLSVGALLCFGPVAAQSKKEEIATLHKRLDSLSQIIGQERSDFTQALQSKDGVIQEQSEELLRLTQDYSEVSSALANQTKSLEIERVELQQARDSIDVLSSEIAAQQTGRDCAMVEIMRFDEFNVGVEWEGTLSCTRYAEYSWHDRIHLRWFWGNLMDEEQAFDAFQLVPGKYYWVKFAPGYDMVSYLGWEAIDVRLATDEDVSNWEREW